MRKLSGLENRAVLLVLAAGCGPAVARAQTLEQVYRQLNPRFQPPASAAQAKALSETGNPKIDPALRALVRDSQTKSLGDLAEEARGVQIPMEDGRIAVMAAAESVADVAELEQRIRDLGGTVEATLDGSVYARVPPRAVTSIGGEQSLAYLGPQGTVSLPPDLISKGGGSTPAGAGVLMTKANVLHARGMTGKGAKVGVIDFGFTGYQALQKEGTVPAPAAVKAFGKDHGWDRINKGTQHGAACVEIIHAMAPDAAIYIASIGDGVGAADDDEIIQAALWLAGEGVEVISFSGGGHYGPVDGTAPLDRLVKKMTDRGIFWVNSAGNEGDGHWSTTTKLNADNLVLAGDKPFLLIQAKGKVVAVNVTWDDWGADSSKPASTQDFDVFLGTVDPRNNDLKIVAASQQPQAGHSAPWEAVAAPSTPGEYFAVFIQAKKVNRAVRMHVIAPGYAGGVPVDETLIPNSSERSIGIPAASKTAFAVGAVNVENAKLEPFSSQGPTDDGRAKPEVSAPDNVFSRAYELTTGGTIRFFPGTSAACPHAAGFAALLRQQTGAVNPEALAKLMSGATTPLVDNRGAGSGLLDGSKIASGGGNTRRNPVPGTPLSGAFALASEENDLGVKVVVGRPDYRIGDGLKIGYRANRTAYCLLIHRSAGGELTPLLPMTGGELRLDAGERYAYPSDSQTTITITGPAGVDEVGLICSASRIALEGIEKADPRSLSVSVAHYRIVE
jgi:hypothetical protein